MTEMEKTLLKKTMTKKAYQAKMVVNRSSVGSGRNLGTREFRSLKDYDRNRQKKMARKLAAEER